MVSCFFKEMEGQEELDGKPATLRYEVAGKKINTWEW